MKTIPTINHPIRSQMKPLPVIETYNALRERQEEHILSFLSDQREAITSREVAEKCDNIPGINISRGYPTTWEVRRVSGILKRLEAKGYILSTLYCGKRYYSTIVGGER